MLELIGDAPEGPYCPRGVQTSRTDPSKILARDDHTLD